MRNHNCIEPSSLLAFAFFLSLGCHVVKCYGAAGPGDPIFYDRIINLRKVLNVCCEIDSFPRTCNMTHLQQQSLFVFAFLE